MDSVKLCECGCGTPAPIAKHTDPRDDHVKGQPRGESHANHKLTDSQVTEVLGSGQTQVSLARRFGVSISAISLIRRGKAWKHLQAVGA